MSSVKKRPLEKILGAGYMLMLLPAICLLALNPIYGFIESYASVIDSNGEITKPGNWLVDIAFDYQERLITLLLFLFALGLSFSYAEKYFKNLWKVAVEPKLAEKVSDVRDEIFGIVSTSTIKGILSNLESAPVKESLRDVYGKIYGAHCLRDNGLFSHVSQEFNPFLPEGSPHRSGYDRNITIIDNNDGTITWHEVCRYRIHCISFDSTFEHAGDVEAVAPTFPLKYFTRSFQENTISTDAMDAYDVKISVSGNNVFDAKKDIYPQGGGLASSNPDIKRIGFDNGKFELQFEKEIELTKDWTEVEINETSLMSKLDNSFILRSKTPICSSRITISLPVSWEFKEISFANKERWATTHNPPHVLTAKTDTWLLPGIIFICTWKAKNELSEATANLGVG